MNPERYCTVESELSLRRRFLNGLARRVEAEPELTLGPGTSVFARIDRAGTGVLVCYWADRHAIVWCDPELGSITDQLIDPGRTIDQTDLGRWCGANDLQLVALADMRVLRGPPRPPDPLPAGYGHRWLLAADPGHLELIRAFTDRNDPDDVEEAGLEDLDSFAERAINVVTSGDQIVAYASAADWEWDPAFADIGVLVDPAHRSRGLGRFVVAATTRRLLTEGALPLYRHGHDNLGSKAIAIGTGFEVATTLAFFARPAG